LARLTRLLCLYDLLIAQTKYVLLAQASGEGEKRFMKPLKKVKYTDENIGNVKVIPDFLPSPENLVMKEDTEKVTLSLTKSSIDFFKMAAKKNHTQYQKMIRNLLNHYASHHQKA